LSENLKGVGIIVSNNCFVAIVKTYNDNSKEYVLTTKNDYEQESKIKDFKEELSYFKTYIEACDYIYSLS